MKKTKDLFKNKKILFWSLNIFIALLIFIPKTVSTLFNIIPTRLLLSCAFIFIYLCDRILNKDSYKKFNITFIIIQILLLLSSIPSLFVTKNIVITLYTIIKFLVAAVLFEICWTKKFTKDEFKIILKTIIISLIVVIIYGKIQYIFDFGMQKIGIDKYSPAKGRVVSTFFNTIYYGIFLNILIGYLFYLNYNTKNIIKRIAVCILLVLCFSSILLTFTRSAFLVFCGIVIIILILNYKMIFNKTAFVSLIICLTLTFILPGASKLVTASLEDGISLVTNINVLKEFLPSINSNKTESESKEETIKPETNPITTKKTTTKPAIITKPTTPEESKQEVEFDDASLQHRKDYAEISNQIANDHKFTGVGFGTYIDYMNSEDFSLKYPNYTGSKTHPHSSLVLLYSEIGIFGCMSFILLFIYLIIYSFKEVLWNKKTNNHSLAIALFVCIIGMFIVNIISENAIYDSQIYPLFLIIISLSFNYLATNRTNKKILFISSTGGHLNEMLELKEIMDKYDSYIVTEKTTSTKNLKENYNKRIDYLVYGTKDHLISYMFKFIFNCFKSIILYLKIKPTHVITTGTHTAVPMCFIAKIFGTKVIFIETFANINTKTLSGKLVYPIADLFIVQWEEMLKLYPNAVYSGWIY